MIHYLILFLCLFLVGNRDSYKEPSTHVSTERYSPVRRASEGSGPPGPGIQALQQEYQQLQRLASPSHSPASIPGSPVHERGVAAITQGIFNFVINILHTIIIILNRKILKLYNSF